MADDIAASKRATCGCAIEAQMRKRKAATNLEPEVPTSRQMFRYWIEIQDVETEVVRRLPVKAYQCIPLKAGEKDEVPPSYVELRVNDDNGDIEDRCFDTIRALLRARYPDEKFVRTLHYERDFEAERRYWSGILALADPVADGIVEDWMKEERALAARPGDSCPVETRLTATVSDVGHSYSGRDEEDSG